MPKIALIKTSSMGDVIHNLPVVSDILFHYPNAEIDWVVEESFSAIPALHPGVKKVIPVAVRRWKRSLFSSLKEMTQFKSKIQREQYDLVIDTQGLIKSAIIASFFKGTRCGFENPREPLAAYLYDAKKPVDRNLHAVDRNRTLAALFMGYSVDNPLDYGLRRQADRGYAVFLHSTSKKEKLWEEGNWVELGRKFDGMPVILPWGSREERNRSERLAAQIPNSSVPERCVLDEAIAMVAGARIAIGVDTGLAHLAAAMEIPVVGIYCSTDPGLTGILSAGKGINLGAKAMPPSAEEVFSTASGFLK